MFLKLNNLDIENILYWADTDNNDMTESEKQTLDKINAIKSLQKLKHNSNVRFKSERLERRPRQNYETSRKD